MSAVRQLEDAMRTEEYTIKEYTIKELEEAVRGVGFEVPRRGKMGDRLYRVVLQSKLARNGNSISKNQTLEMFGKHSSTRKILEGHRYTMVAVDEDARLRIESE